LTPVGWYYLGPDFNWHPENDLTKWSPVYQGALFDMNSTAILRSATLPAGNYVFYFGVDERNGKVNDGIWFDAVQIAITP